MGCGKPFNTDNFDFGLHRKRSKEIGWDTTPIKKKKLTHGNSLNNTSADGAIIKKTLTPKSESTALHDQNSKTPELDSKDLADGFGKFFFESLFTIKYHVKNEQVISFYLQIYLCKMIITEYFLLDQVLVFILIAS